MSDLKIYVGSLSDYNAGRLHGVFIDPAQEPDDIWAEINKMLKESPSNKSIYEGPAEEWRIDDYEGFGDYRIDSYESIENISKIAIAAEECYADNEVFFFWLSHYVDDLSEYNSTELVDAFSDDYCGEHDSERSFASDYIDECGWNGVPPVIELTSSILGTTTQIKVFDEIAGILDLDSVWSSLSNDGYCSADINGSTHIFRRLY